MTENTNDSRRGEVDWAVLVKRIQERMYLSQMDISQRCGVARQTVSAWLHRRRMPGLYAKRELIILAAEAGVLDDVAEPGQTEGQQPLRRNIPAWLFNKEEQGDATGVDSVDARQLRVLLDQLPEQAREEVLEFARFKIFRERG